MKEEKKNRKKKTWKYFSSHKLLYVMLIPMLVYFLLFNYYPMLGLQLAFKDWNPWLGIWGSPLASVEGHLDVLKHFKYLFFETEEFWLKFGNTLRISVLKMAFGFPMPILIALFMNEMLAVKYKKVVQTVSYLPHFISWVIISGILLSMGSADSDFQLFLQNIFGKQIYFFNDDDYFLLLLVVSDIWKSCGWGTIIYLAALASVPMEEYEAAVIDGAGRMQKMIYITLPAILPAVSIRLIFELSGLTSAGFDQIFNMRINLITKKIPWKQALRKNPFQNLLACLTRIIYRSVNFSLLLNKPTFKGVKK